MYLATIITLLEFPVNFLGVSLPEELSRVGTFGNVTKYFSSR